MKAIKPLAYGQPISHPLEYVTVLLSQVGTPVDPTFRAATLYGSTGAEVEELTESFESERIARGIARALSILGRGRTADQICDEVATYSKPGQRQALAIIDAALDEITGWASSPRRWAEENALLAVRDELLDAAVRAEVDRGVDQIRRHLLATWNAA